MINNLLSKKTDENIVVVPNNYLQIMEIVQNVNNSNQ